MARPRTHKGRDRSSAAPRRLTVAIDEIGARGDGVARDNGERIFVPLTAPGDLAVVEARGERGALIELIEPSSHRALPPCPHFGECGGCALQHVTERFYRDWKRKRVVEALSRAGVDAAVEEVIATRPASRRRATFSVVKPAGRAVVGFNARQSAAVVGVDECKILHPDLRASLPALANLVQKIDARSFDLAVTLCRNGLDVDIPGRATAPRGAAMETLPDAMRSANCLRLSLAGEPLITLSAPVVDFDGVPVTPPPGGFLQASKDGEGALLALVKEALAGARKIADLFCGCGSFSLPLARTASVLAVDSDASAIAALVAAGAAAQRAMKINPVRTEIRNLFERPLLRAELDTFDAIVFDPPRIGAAAQAKALATSRVENVVAVSCNPATFARDAAILSQGGFRLRKVTPVDQFVYSPHVELVAEFTRRGCRR